MERLKGKTILIGKEPGQGRLLVSVVVNGQTKTAALGQPGSVPACVSRCRPADGVGHCKITVDGAGGMTLTNLKAQNITCVNGVEVASKRITPSSSVALGCDRFAVDLGAVLNAARKVVGTPVDGGGLNPPEQPEYSIRHLEKIWRDHREAKKKIRIRQKNLNLIGAIPFSLSGLLTVLAYINPEMESLRSEFGITTAVIMVIGLCLRFMDKSIQEEERLDDKFQDHYVCPNPKCHHFVGNQPYKILRQSKNCPCCKCKWTDQ